MPFQITISPELHAACPQFVGTAVLATFENSPHSDALWQEIDRFLNSYRSLLTIDSIKEMPSIQATRQAYKRLGKDPSRYRPSGEALVRRALQGKELYQIDTAVDLINLASIAYGYSIGGFDADKVQGESLCLGVGREGEPYEGIGRGPLNIASLPVYRDAAGGIGTPTSDHERTKLELSSRRLLAIVNGYDGNREQTTACAQYIQQLLKKYAASDGGELMQF